jgi:hypothetical protein
VSKRSPPLLRATLELLEAAGAEEIISWHGGKHHRVRASYKGQPIYATVAVSPHNEWRARRKQSSAIRRQLRAIDTANHPNPSTVSHEEILA